MIKLCIVCARQHSLFLAFSDAAVEFANDLITSAYTVNKQHLALVGS